ncbi:hypothetical protein SAMN05443429_1231 [Cruoricaptor ignavus]|uniref:Uncharacterized protein n=1 Tax=Cruoricaptor ignavus TaxID=1118202 RepID=A0A1M6HWY0_9FLAO|nr:hypothetical protein SAMN05443429_1231 [Cruoricaptor ignavus]
MIYKDLLKVSIYFVAIKLFIDFGSQLPERIYNSFYLKTGSLSVDVLLYTLINLFFIILLLAKGGFFVDILFKEKKELLKESFKSSNAVLKIALIVCSYYVILNSLFSLIMILPNFQFNSYTLGVLMNIIISFLILFFSEKISVKYRI